MALLLRGARRCAAAAGRPTSLGRMTAEQWPAAVRESVEYARGGGLAAMVLRQLRQQDCPSTRFGMALNLYQHGLQTATRALRNGEGEEMVVMCLLHDVCEHTVPSGHGGAAALILGPYLSPANLWTLQNHELFQGYYYYHLAGMDPNARDVHRDSPHFDACARFCELYDEPSFDPGYEAEPLEVFEPMVRSLFSREPRAQGDCAMMFLGAA